jgi:hypothetical protein
MTSNRDFLMLTGFFCSLAFILRMNARPPKPRAIEHLAPLGVAMVLARHPSLPVETYSPSGKRKSRLA